jgi:hypothetical protein
MLEKQRCGLHIKHPMKRHIILQQNNSFPHTAHLTWAKTEKFSWEGLPHPPYSLHLACLDYQLFRLLKDHMREQYYKKKMRQSSKPSFYSCKILKQTSFTVAYLSLCSAGRNGPVLWKQVAVHKTVLTQLQNTETNVYHSGIFKVMQCWQKCLDCSGYFSE